jgi:threonylcarbamoyladenosine tRNA methylthiotransferase MtaB
MPTAAFATLGCKVNQYETQRLIDTFEERGFEVLPLNEQADVYVINTCSVTQSAERKSRQMVRRLARQNPAAAVVMTGCYGEMARIKGETVEEATVWVPNAEKLNALEHLLRHRPDLAPSAAAGRRSVSGPEASVRRTRATIKVQDGCNVFCSFCSIPYTRSRLVSRPLDEVVTEAEGLALRGYRELVVTGVLVGWYGEDLGKETTLAQLLRRLCRVEGIERVRLSSIEPTQVTDELLQTFAEEPKLCSHLHIPLQSGDSRVLRGMNRPYDQEFYLERCFTAQKLLPDVAITSDIMVGFPGEDEEAFLQTVKVSQEVGFARAHIFRYSPRPGTPAALRSDQVDDAEKEVRAHHLADVCRETQQSYIRRYLGSVQEVLVEGRERTGGLLSGYTANYIKALFAGGTGMVGTVQRVRLMETTADGALCEAADALQPEADIIPLTLVSGTVQRA